MGPLAEPWDLHENDFPATGSLGEQLRFLVRYAVLAPSFRNLQPWRFEVDGRLVALYVDLGRRQRAADLRQRDLYASLGCALENLLVAAAHFGLRYEVDYFPLLEEDELVAQARFSPPAGAAPLGEPLLQAITRRHTQHGRYADRTIESAVLDELRGCGREAGLTLLLTQGASIREAVDQLLARAGAIAVERPAYREELERAIAAGGFDAPGAQNAPAFGLIGTDKAGRVAQVRAGRVLERLSLAAALHGISVQPLSVLLEFDEVAALFTRMFRAGGVPLLPLRLGYAEQPARLAPRRPLADVLR
jgi:hypothetical protein